MRKLSVAFCIVGLLMICAAPAFSADADVDALSKRVDKIESAIGTWSFYGSARMHALWIDKNAKAGGDRDLTYDLQGNSRFGANVKKGNIGGSVELGIDDTAGVTTRLFNGYYTFGDSQILVGQAYTPIESFISNQVYNEDWDFLNIAPAYDNRMPMVRYKNGGFMIALVKQPKPAVTGAANADIDEKYPKLEAQYKFTASNFWASVHGGFSTYSVWNTAHDKEFDIPSYVGAITAGVTLKPVFVNMTAYYGQNVANFGLWTSGAASAVVENNEVKDVKSYGAALIVGLDATKNVRFEAGAGLVSHDSDKIGTTDKDETYAAYLQCVYTVAPGFSITPEVGYFDYRKNSTGVDEGKMGYGVVKFQIDF